MPQPKTFNRIFGVATIINDPVVLNRKDNKVTIHFLGEQENMGNNKNFNIRFIYIVPKNSKTISTLKKGVNLIYEGKMLDVFPKLNMTSVFLYVASVLPDNNIEEVREESEPDDFVDSENAVGMEELFGDPSG